MKNIIAITSLLAAGTALANAELTTVAEWNDFSDLTSDVGTSLTFQAVGSNSPTIQDGKIVFSSSVADDIYVNGLSLTADTTGYTLRLEVENYSYYNGAIAYTNSDTTNYSNGIGVGTGQKSGNNEWSAFFSGSNSGVSQSQTNNFASPYSGTIYACVTEGAVNIFVWDSSADEYVLAQAGTSTSFSGTDNTLVLGGWANSGNGAAFTLKSLGIYTGTTTLEALNVPEPSAFGLMAGAGALALVAARRRRRKA
ncbi:MAG: PEP-CTERM sorting domain-containing protein [Candidatus Spyradosoma sp.]